MKDPLCLYCRIEEVQQAILNCLYQNSYETGKWDNHTHYSIIAGCTRANASGQQVRKILTNLPSPLEKKETTWKEREYYKVLKKRDRTHTLPASNREQILQAVLGFQVYDTFQYLLTQEQERSTGLAPWQISVNAGIRLKGMSPPPLQVTSDREQMTIVKSFINDITGGEVTWEEISRKLASNYINRKIEYRFSITNEQIEEKIIAPLNKIKTAKKPIPLDRNFICALLVNALRQRMGLSTADPQSLASARLGEVYSQRHRRNVSEEDKLQIGDLIFAKEGSVAYHTGIVIDAGSELPVILSFTGFSQSSVELQITSFDYWRSRPQEGQPQYTGKLHIYR